MRSLTSLLVGYTLNAVMNTVSTLLVDLVSSQSASITACVSPDHFFQPKQQQLLT